MIDYQIKCFWENIFWDGVGSKQKAIFLDSWSKKGLCLTFLEPEIESFNGAQRHPVRDGRMTFGKKILQGPWKVIKMNIFLKSAKKDRSTLFLGLQFQVIFQLTF